MIFHSQQVDILPVIQVGRRGNPLLQAVGMGAQGSHLHTGAGVSGGGRASAS